jgi:hypothetical protein
MSVTLVNADLDIRSCGIATVTDNTFTTVSLVLPW